MLEGYQFNPNRVENIYEIIRHYTSKREYRAAELFYNLITPVTYPNGEKLFIKDDVYDFLLNVEFIIFKYHLVTDKTNEFKVKMSKFIFDPMNAKYMSLEIFNNLLTNIGYYLPILPKKGKKVSIVGQDYKDFWSNKMYGGNSSITYFKDDTEECYYLNQKYVNYTLNHEKKVLDFKYHNLAVNRLIKYNMNFKLVSEVLIQPVKINDPTDSYYNLEDLRLFNHNKELIILGTLSYSRMGMHKVEMFYGKYDPKLQTYLYEVIHSPYNKGCEKNWTLFENGKKEIKTVYK